MCALRAHINKSSFGKVLLGIEKVVKTFSISDKLFPKLVYYCVPLGHTLVKSKKTYKILFIIFCNVSTTTKEVASHRTIV